MSNTTLIQAFSDIADAIRMKGVTGTMTPLEMPTKIGNIQTSKYGLTLDNFLGSVNANGAIQAPTNGALYSTQIKSIPNWSAALQYRFYRDTKITGVSLPNLTTIGHYGINNTFYGCTSLVSVDLSGATSIGDYGINNAFRGCTSLTSANFSNVASGGQYGLNASFYGCTSLKTVYLNKFSSSGANCMAQTFQGCTALEVVDFSQATAVPAINSNTFQNTNNTFKVVVPDALYNSWIAATNWSALSSQIVKASEYTPAS